jgi:hypothetical protein
MWIDLSQNVLRFYGKFDVYSIFSKLESETPNIWREADGNRHFEETIGAKNQAMILSKGDKGRPQDIF